MAGKYLEARFIPTVILHLLAAGRGSECRVWWSGEKAVEERWLIFVPRKSISPAMRSYGNVRMYRLSRKTVREMMVVPKRCISPKLYSYDTVFKGIVYLWRKCKVISCVKNSYVRDDVCA